MNLLSLTRLRYPSYRVRATDAAARDGISQEGGGIGDDRDDDDDDDNDEVEEERGGEGERVVRCEQEGEEVAGERSHDQKDDDEIYVPCLDAYSRFKYYGGEAEGNGRVDGSLPSSSSPAAAAAVGQRSHRSGSDDDDDGGGRRGREMSSSSSRSANGDAAADGKRGGGGNRFKSIIAGGVCVCIAGILRRPGAAVGVLLVVSRTIGKARRGSSRRRPRNRRRGRRGFDVMRGRG